MVKSRKSTIKLFSPLGFAMLAMLAFGAIGVSAAQASPEWHVNGKTLKEAGLTQAPYNIEGGKISLDIPDWNAHINCVENYGFGYVVGQSSGNAHINATSCSIEGAPKCNVAPMELDLSLGLISGGGTGVVETFTAMHSSLAELVVTGLKCSFPVEEVELPSPSGSFGAEVGAEAVKLPLTGQSSYAIKTSIGSNVVNVTWTGSITQQEAVGRKLGAW